MTLCILDHFLRLFPLPDFLLLLLLEGELLFFTLFPSIFGSTSSSESPLLSGDYSSLTRVADDC